MGKIRHTVSFVSYIVIMASVMFIIRVPCKKNPKSLKTEGESECRSSEENRKIGISGQRDDDERRKIVAKAKGKDGLRSDSETGQAMVQNTSEQSHTHSDTEDLETISDLDIAEVLQNELRSLNVQGDSWTVTNDKQFHQVLFLERTGERVKKILERLTHVGVGMRQKSSVVESVKGQAETTFDSVMFTILASMIAAVGLVEDNAVVLVASILVSPLMGPILGATFGTVIKNKELQNTGLKTELLGLFISVVVGFVFGFIPAPFGVNGASWDSTKGIWPTNEMTSRGVKRGLWVDVLIALPSGAGVALSVLGDNIRSLVGVAISASLLVPAVNSGMLCAYSFFAAIKPPKLLENAEFSTSKLNCSSFKDNSYEPMYSCDMGKEAAIMAIISLGLTVVNIICIFITATIVLKIKEVTPKASSSNASQEFWTKDVKVAREAYQTFKGNHAVNFLKEWEKFNQSQRPTREGSQDFLHDQENEESIDNVERPCTLEGLRDSLRESKELLDMIEEVEDNEKYQSVVRRAPRGALNLHKCSKFIKKLISKGADDNPAEKEAKDLQNQLRNLHTYYTKHAKDKIHYPHVGTIFNEPEPPAKKSDSVREFHVVETENPLHSSVYRVHSSPDDSNTRSAKAEHRISMVSQM